MPLPNFLIIGAGNSGTTSLYHYLGQHPDIYVCPIKEPGFFSSTGEAHFAGPGDARRRVENDVLDLGSYEALFDDASEHAARGEATSSYLCTDGTAERIHALIPDAKLIAILRDPAARALSNYAHMVNWTMEWHPTFRGALEAEDQRVREGWHPIWLYRERGYYFRQLERYIAVFDRSQLEVLLYDDLKANPTRVVQRVYRFLDVDDAFRPETSIRYNPSHLPRSRRLHDFLRYSGPLRRAVRPVVRAFLGPELRHRIWSALYHGNWQPPRQSRRIRRELIEAYRDDILKLQDFLNRDLGAWLDPNPRKARR